VNAATKTVWIEMPNGTGHWASNWELRQIAEKKLSVPPDRKGSR
jgi:hypothetical protein